MTSETHAERVVGITNELYKARRILRSLHSDEDYAREIADYGKSIRSAMAANGCGPVEGGMHCIRLLQERLPGSGFAQMWVMAAVVEMVESERKDR